MIPTTETIFEVAIELDRWAADLVRGRKWHASQVTNVGWTVLGQLAVASVEAPMFG